MNLEVRGLKKAYRTTAGRERAPAVDTVSFSVEAGQFFTLLGPSGCGKTTTLRCVAGLEIPDQGLISLGGRTLYSSAPRVLVPGNQRGLGMVFQNYAVWPHMTVFENVAFPLECRPRRFRPSRAEMRRRVGAMLEVVRLSHFGDRPATDLSGGQQQRLALARALIMEPPALLLDEPLSNLDAGMRAEMRAELTRVQKEFGVTTIYVTHDQAEALAMSNIIAVMRDGKIEQIGDPLGVYRRPASQFVAEFLGASNLIRGVVFTTSEAASDRYRCTAKTLFGQVDAISDGPISVGQQISIAVRPEALKLVSSCNADGSRVDGGLRGRLMSKEFLGDNVLMVVAAEAETVRVRCEPDVVADIGAMVHLGLKDPGIILH